ncbi:MAG: hypothetical protein KGD63_00780 [Candidatus Lokiarchaeota archaeon]|nr:hypothetical protein [Candidatus Lokiarchaeota archaeon]
MKYSVDSEGNIQRYKDESTFELDKYAVTRDFIARNVTKGTMTSKRIHRPPDELISRYLSRRYSQDKYNRIRAIVIEQLQKYSESGERLYRTSQVGIRENDVREYTKLILDEVFRDENRGRIVYDLIFGRAYTSYHSLRLRTNRAGLKLKITPIEWFYSIPNRMQSCKLSVTRIKVECRHGHETHKSIIEIGRAGCLTCDQIKKIEEGWYIAANTKLGYDDVIKYFADTPFELISRSKQYNDAISYAKSNGKQYTDGLLRWRHRECRYEFDRSYLNMMRTFSCPKCSQKKNQKITHGLCEYAFDTPFEVEINMKKIFSIHNTPEIKDLGDTTHIDIFQNLRNLKDKNGNLARDRNGNPIKLAIRYNGKQHNNTPEGFEAFKGIAKHPDVEYRSEKWRILWKNWRRLIRIDKIKRKLFERNEKNGYYLIEVAYNVPKDQRLDYMYNKFEELTSIKIERKENIDWRLLL